MGDIPLTNRLLQFFEVGGPDNRGSDSFETPSDGYLGHIDTLLLGELLDAEKE